MDFSEEQLRNIIKQSIKEALSEFYQNQPEPSKPTDAEKTAEEPIAPQNKASSDGIPTYEELFHRIMSQVARGSIDEHTAGKLLSEAYQTFGGTAKEAPPKQPTEENTGSAGESKTHDLLMRIANWEKELSTLTGEAAESTLEMMERMRAKITQETSKAQKREDEAKMYQESQKIEKEEQEKRAAEKLKSMKDKISSEK